MKIVILGGTGFIGRHLQQFLMQHGHQVKAYGRKVFTDGEQAGAALIDAVNDQDLVIMLAGENIGKRWNKAYKQALLDSRINTAKQLKDALSLCAKPPAQVFAASAVGIYPQTACDDLLDEYSATSDSGFLAQLGQAWEAQSKNLADKVVIFRFGVVLGKDGGALAKMLPAFKLGLGGPVAGGQQCFSWIHIDDLCRALLFAIEKTGSAECDIHGIYNLTSPKPVSNQVFGQALAKQLKRPFWLPLPLWQLKIMFGEGAQVLTHSAAVYPTKLLQAGFTFDYADINDALANLCADK
ncbi:TIGR01777 family oxidoreductase [Thiomicrorhabdus sediminis]|uniref:TIGR01777 family protein n=1 Tax=Thiomicrorhabdus sediminis TaxID=2580412 RepID=A0A4P9K650_9GAMM|nr:TIGR01777 family oxidoreductase [Thiomicrorhabdus sediminis]QCU89940.1 TIGR01777 family protein [Thiomicrorhabdus sediminis]